MVIYRGFSFHEYEDTKSFSVTDVDLVKLDILNHIFTRTNSRFRQVNHGSNIPDLVFEQLTDTLLDELYDSLETIFNFDPRVTLLEMTVTPNPAENSVSVSATLRYVELKFTETLDLNILVEQT